ncbi:DinB family protein [Flavobacterium sp. FlaQc-47]|uniref:DinB family protein n=1 Tax=Flavobacterium sp. FlaQc-47 TaxID=3374180 RepID=UPI003757AF5F
METTKTSGVYMERSIIYQAWLLQNRKISDLVRKLDDEDLTKDVAFGRNSGLYLLGHLIASNDLLLPLFDFGEKLYPEYEKIFLCCPDKCAQNFPTVKELKSHWFALNEYLNLKFASINEEQGIIESDKFCHQLKTMLTIINHQCYHLGQLAFLL